MLGSQFKFIFYILNERTINQSIYLSAHQSTAIVITKVFTAVVVIVIVVITAEVVSSVSFTRQSVCF